MKNFYSFRMKRAINGRKVDIFDAKKCLPQNIIIKSAETQLYRIGLSFESYDYVIRNKYNNPKIVFVICLFVLIKTIIALFLPNNNYLLVIIGDFFHFLSEVNSLRFCISVGIL